MHEHRKIAVGEGGLAVRDRVERDGGIGNDPLAITLCDSAVVKIKVGATITAIDDGIYHVTRGSGKELEVYLVRLLFILFADDTGIFEQDAFYNFIVDQTREDGTDIGGQLARLFQLLNTP